MAVVRAAGCIEYKGENSMKDLTPLLVEEGHCSATSSRRIKGTDWRCTSQISTQSSRVQ